jgi:AcrR family transcriptional regulator
MAYRKTPATKARKDARRRTILDAATRLFGAYGYHSTTVPMIVAESDSSVGSFYVHFRNKEDVFAAVLEALGEKVTEVMYQARDSQPDALLGIRSAVESRVFVVGDQPRGVRRGVAFSVSGRQPGGCADSHRRILRP